ncbi:MAG: hypothetical protein QM690_03940 [Sphingobium sp.]
MIEPRICFIQTMWQPFFKAVFLGTVAGGAPMAVLTTVLAVISLVGGEIGLLPFIWLSMIPFVVAFPLVLGVSTVIGLPLTAFLKQRQWESQLAYIVIGIIVGFILPIIVLRIMEAPAGYWIALLGALAGGVTSRTWWIAAREPTICYSD